MEMPSFMTPPTVMGVSGDTSPPFSGMNSVSLLPRNACPATPTDGSASTSSATAFGGNL